MAANRSIDLVIPPQEYDSRVKHRKIPVPLPQKARATASIIGSLMHELE